MARLQLAAAFVLGLVALAVWWGFLRRAPETTAIGVVEARVHKPPGEFQRVPMELQRGFRTPTRIPLAEAWLFEVRLDEPDEVVGVSLNAILGRGFDIGDRVRLSFARRGFPPLWTRITVTSMEHVEP